MLVFLYTLATANAAPPLCAGRESGEVDVVTFNVWGLPAPVAKDRRGRMPQIAQFIGDSAVDLVGLQEVWAGARPMLSLDGLLFPPRDAGDSGLAVVTALDATPPEVTSFDEARGPDALKHKGVLQTHVHLPSGEPLWTLVTHLQAGRSDASARVRRSQVEQILTVLAGLEGPAVVMGDFNLYDQREIDDGTRDRLESAGLVDVAEQLGETSVTHPEGERFDRVYVRGGGGVCLAPVLAEVLEPDRPLSDHHPVHARVAVHSTP